MYRRRLLELSLVALSSHGFYFFSLGFPAVQVGGAVLLVFAAFLYPGPRLEGLPARRLVLFSYGILALTSMSAVRAAMSVGSLQVKGPLAFAVGLALLVRTIASGDEFRTDIREALRILLVVHTGAWLLQFLVYQTTGTVLDYIEPVTGTTSRYLSGYYTGGFSGVVARFTGFFHEPAHYVAFVFLAVSARLTLSRFQLSWIDIVGVVTIILSLAISGYVYVGVLLIYVIAFAKPRKRGVYAAAFLTIFAVGLFLWKPDYFLYVVDRGSRIDEDASANVRFSGSWEFFDSLPDDVKLLGRGVGAYGESGKDNGLVFLLLYLGGIGTFAFLGLFAFLIGRTNIPRFGLWLVTLASALQTNPFWWFWSALLALDAFPFREQLRRDTSELVRTDVASVQIPAVRDSTVGT